MTIGHNIAHTVCTRGKRVAVGLKNGHLVTGKFLRRAKNNRWIEVEIPSVFRDETQLVRISRAEIESFSIIKGPLDHRRLGRKP